MNIPNSDLLILGIGSKFTTMYYITLKVVYKKMDLAKSWCSLFWPYYQKLDGVALWMKDTLCASPFDIAVIYQLILQ